MATILGILLLGLLVWLVFRPTNRAPEADSEGKAARAAKHTASTSLRAEPGQRDQWEGSFWEARQAVNFKRDVRLVYTDAAGSRTIRKVSIRAFEPFNDEGLVIGHCHLRDATRTFRYDRMNECVDLETGEIVQNLRTHLLGVRADAPEGLADRLVNEHRDLLKLLLYMARADGRMLKAEIAVIATTCSELTGQQHFDPETVKTALLTCDEMTFRGFERACRDLATSNPPQFAAFTRAAQAIVATQKTIHPQEKAALEMIQMAALPARTTV